MDFAVPVVHRVKIKESEKRDQYFDLARKLRKLWNMRVTVMPIVIGALGTVPKELVRGLEEVVIGRRVVTIETTALLRTVRIQRVLKICKKLKKRIIIIIDFAVPGDHKIKVKEGEKKNKYVNLARELKKKLWKMKVTIIPIVIGIFGTVTKGLLKELEDLEVGGRVKTIQTTTLLRTARILRRVLEI